MRLAKKIMLAIEIDNKIDKPPIYKEAILDLIYSK